MVYMNYAYYAKIGLLFNQDIVSHLDFIYVYKLYWTVLTTYNILIANYYGIDISCSSTNDKLEKICRTVLL